MRHTESNMQIGCVTWMRYNFPAYARLLFHPKNEGNGNHKQGTLAKKEGVQPGVADLMLPVPSGCYHSLAIELKSKTGRQESVQKEWQRYFESAGGKYVIVRSREEFETVIRDYLKNVPADVHKAINHTYGAIIQEQYEEERKRVKKIFGGKE